jgi:dihydroflavonol-4-reductase
VGLSVVTGAAGFIGSAVVRALLRRGERVRAVIEPGGDASALADLEVEHVSADVRDHEAMLRALAGADALYHLAAIYRVWTPDPSLLWSVNVDGTVATLLAAQKAGTKRVVYTSSLSTLGIRDDGRPGDETTPFNLWEITNHYIHSKIVSEHVALDFARAGLPLVVVLPGFPFGPRDTAPTPTGGIVLSILQGKVPGVSAGGFSAIDVDDCGEGHVLAAERGRVGERYLLSNHNVHFADFVRLVCRLAGKRQPRLYVPKVLARAASLGFEWWADHVSHTPPISTYRATQYMQRAVYFDSAKSRRELALPCTPLETSVERAIAWFRANGRV